MTIRSAFCFVWQSEGTDYVNRTARQEKRNDSLRYEEAGGLTIRSAFCFVWQSEGTDYLNRAARQEKRR
ncbi:hypothetical protein AB3N04_07545 [Alkalihalophilus sp. As8PL]|uniref:Uncharacterized protein n=1 Tax=Alkalihalophilus sp. As8PL TaxID=3237103 RepID=A0AB39BWH6_9BACI